MELKKSEKNNLVFRIFRILARVRINVTLALFLVILIILIIIGSYFYIVLEGDITIGKILFHVTGDESRISYGSNIKAENIVIEVKDEHYEKLALKRDEALNLGYLNASTEDFVPATITHDNKMVNAEIRLKGDMPDHWEDEDKWSFRIELKGDNTLFGMKKFSIQKPETRGSFNEWLMHNLFGYADLINLRYDFIDVTFYGKHLGTYALEEHFDNILIENNQYITGPIIRFEDLYNPLSLEEIYFVTSIDAFQTKSIKVNDIFQKQFNEAKNLLESFRLGELMAHQVFDIEKLANFFAINELSGRHHAARYPNMRFYYNPVTSLLEPIAYDINYILPANYIEGDNNRIEVKEDREASFTDAFFSDRIFFSKYIQALQQVSDKEWLDSFFKSIKKEYNEKLIILSTETPSYFFDGKDILYDNQEFLKKILNIDKGMQAYFKQYNKDSNLLEIELGNIQMFPIEVIDMQYSDEILFMPSTGIYLPSKEALKPIEFVVEEFLISDQIIWSDEMVDDLNVRYKILGTDNILQQPVIPWAHLDDNFIENDFIRQEPNWKEFGFIQTNEELKQITIEPGSWKIGKNLIIPEGYHFVLGEGTELDLSNSAKILSYSPLEFIGSEDRPIVIKSADSAGQGIVVINSKNISILKYVNFDNLTAPTQGDWGLTGAITFYESPVDIYYCKFTKNRESDDYLNIIRSEFIIDTSLFNNTFADAVDIDFSNGSILNSTFIDCGNGDGNGDCLDFSGSGVELNGILINRAGDKGISIGENSQVVGNGIEVGNSRIAVASKDLSEVVLDNVTIHDSEIGYAVYQKKSEYGPASIKISTDNSENVKTYYLLEEGSSLILRNEKMKPNHKDVYMSLYGE